MNKKIAALKLLLIFGLIATMSMAGLSVAQEKMAEPQAAQEQKTQEKVEAPTSTVQGTQPQVEAAVAEEPAPAATAEKSSDVPATEAGNITVNFKGAEIRTVLAYIAEVSGVDIVPAPDVKGIVDLKLTNKPWKTALDIILRNYGFAYEREGDIIRVVTIDKLKQEELSTQVFSLNYGKAKDIVKGVTDIVSERGKVMYDERTNTVLVTDIPTKLYKIGQVVERLDKQTPQVQIEAMIIETALTDDEKMGIDWNVKFMASGAKRPTTLPFEQFKTPFQSKDGEGTQYFPQVQTGSPQVVTVANVGTQAVPLADFPTAAGAFPEAFPFATKDMFTFGTLDFTEFTAVLEMIKSRADTEVVSNPRIATLNNQDAVIHVGPTVHMPKFERNSLTGKMEITGYEILDKNMALKTGIDLKVTPHINDKNEIVVDLEPTLSDDLTFQKLDAAGSITAPIVNERSAKTQIMVRDGDTIFIGGLIKEDDIKIDNKLPILGDLLSDVPGLGFLVSHKTTRKQKKELIFFITVNMIRDNKAIKGTPTREDTRALSYTMIKEASKASTKKVPKKKPF